MLSQSSLQHVSRLAIWNIGQWQWLFTMVFLMHDLQVVKLTFEIDLLKDEVTDIDLVGPTLQSLKKLLEKVPEDDHERLKYEKVVHGLLSACLLNVDAMRSVGKVQHMVRILLTYQTEVGMAPRAERRLRTTCSRLC
jgi:hypothetical protein